MRFLVAMLLVTAACTGSTDALGISDDENSPEEPNGGQFASCTDSSECRPAAATCCECPTFATRVDDPKAAVCDQVDCPPSTCAESVEAACNLATNQCELRCLASVCDLACDAGFVIEPNGCLTCAC